MPKRTREQIEKRLAAVERALLELPWTVATQSGVGADWGVNARQVRDDALTIRGRWAAEAKATGREGQKADWLQRVRFAQSHAMSQNQSIALSRLLQIEAKCCGFESAIEVNVNHNVESMNPTEQARAIVENYEAARMYLDTVSSVPQAIDAEFECMDTGVDTGRAQK
jgi:uncharacterized protein (DUF885 family)